MLSNETHSSAIDAMRSRKIVWIERSELDESGAYSVGYVVRVSEELVLLSRISDRFDIDGFEVLRLADATRLSAEFDRAGFYEEVERVKMLEPQPPGEVDIENMGTLFSSLARSNTIIVIERERIAPGECQIGTIRLLGADAYTIRWLDPTAVWEDHDQVYRLSDVTRLGFGGEYETTLGRIAESRG